jgi:hypothetical protein
MCAVTVAISGRLLTTSPVRVTAGPKPRFGRFVGYPDAGQSLGDVPQLEMQKDPVCEESTG